MSRGSDTACLRTSRNFFSSGTIPFLLPRGEWRFGLKHIIWIAKMTSILSCEWIFSETWRNTTTYISFPEMGSELGWGMSSDCEDDSRQISLLSHQVEEQRAKSRWNSSVLQGKFWSLELGVRLIKEYFEVGRTSEAVSPPSSSSPSCFSSLSPSFPTSSPQCSGEYCQIRKSTCQSCCLS